MIKQETIAYQIERKTYRGYWALPKEEEPLLHKRPAILVIHAWMGQDQFARDKADELAQMGFIAFAVDLYGEGKTASNPTEAEQLMLPLFEDRSLLQKRVRGALDEVCKRPEVDPSKLGAIGFCFGGLAAIELLRSGASMNVVSFHAILGTKKGSVLARTVPIAKDIKGSLLVLHGHQDPLVSQEDILKLQKEMTEAKVDWQMNIYGHTSHAFTNPQMHDEAHGLIYQPLSAQRGWWAMTHFFSERLGLKATANF